MQKYIKNQKEKTRNKYINIDQGFKNGVKIMLVGSTIQDVLTTASTDAAAAAASSSSSGLNKIKYKK